MLHVSVLTELARDLYYILASFYIKLQDIVQNREI